MISRLNTSEGKKHYQVPMGNRTLSRRMTQSTLLILVVCMTHIAYVPDTGSSHHRESFCSSVHVVAHRSVES